jgi:hypothetical protein
LDAEASEIHVMLLEKFFREVKEPLANPTLVVIGESEHRKVVAQSVSRDKPEQENLNEAVTLNFSIGQRKARVADKFEDVFALKGGKVAKSLEGCFEYLLTIRCSTLISLDFPLSLSSSVSAKTEEREMLTGRSGYLWIQPALHPWVVHGKDCRVVRVHLAVRRLVYIFDAKRFFEVRWGGRFHRVSVLVSV